MQMNSHSFLSERIESPQGPLEGRPKPPSEWSQFPDAPEFDKVLTVKKAFLDELSLLEVTRSDSVNLKVIIETSEEMDALLRVNVAIYRTINELVLFPSLADGEHPKAIFPFVQISCTLSHLFNIILTNPVLGPFLL